MPVTVTRRPGRPPADAPVLDRAALLDAAARAFAQGYAATSVRALARELGVSQSAVQHHARTKEELLYAVIDEVLVPRLAASGGVARSLPAGATGVATDGAQRVRALVRDRIEALAAHGGVVLSVLSDRSPGATARRERLLAAMAPPRARALAALRSLSDAGITRPVSPETWTMLSIAAIPAIAQVWPMLGLVDPEADGDRGRVLDEVADLFVLGLLPRR